KDGTCVLDFANDPDQVRDAFSRYYTATRLNETTDPNQLYDLEARLKRPGFYLASDLAAFREAFYKGGRLMDRVQATLRPVVERYDKGEEEERIDFRSALAEYVRLYAFLAQVLTFQDEDLEALYQFARLLYRALPVPREEQPRELRHF